MQLTIRLYMSMQYLGSHVYTVPSLLLGSDAMKLAHLE